MADPFWMLFESHRRNIHAAIDAVAGRQDSTIGLVGAGRCHDIDLRLLAERFGEVLLVDIDRTAVEEAIARQDVSGPGIVTVAPFDVTGVAEAPADTGVDAFLARLSTPPVLPFRRPLDGIVSQCVLSQLMLALLGRFGEEHPRFGELAEALRAAHLRFLLQSVRPGGWALLVCDLVASDTLPALLDGPFTQRTVRRMAADTVAEGNFFAGLAPALITRTCEQDPWLADANARCDMHQPWIWTDRPHHARLVYAATVRRAPAGD